MARQRYQTSKLFRLNTAVQNDLSKCISMIVNMSFITIHYCLFIIVPLITSIIFWEISTPKDHVRYIDSVFLCISAVTEAGLNPINLSKVNTGQQVILFLLTIIGSPLITSAAVLVIRKNAFENRFNAVTDRYDATVPPTETNQRYTEQTTPVNKSNSTCSTTLSSERESEDDQKDNITDKHLPSHQLSRHTSERAAGSSMRPLRSDQDATSTKQRNNSKDVEQPNTLVRRFSKLDKYIDTANGYIGRNSAIGGLTHEEKCALGGVEYRAISLLCWVVPVYLIVWQLLGTIAMGIWCHFYLFDASAQNGLNAFWNGAFFAVSAFNNSGMALLDLNAIAFQTSYFPLLVLSLLILAGNTCFPPFLRLTMWIAKHCIPEKTESTTLKERRKTISFILDHPRRVYTHLFPSSATWWVVVTLFVLNGIDWAAFELFNIGNPAIESIPPRYRVLDGLFQAFAVRIGGFAVVNIANLRPALLTVYVVMMYISVYPITMAIRNTNVYEEQSLGIFPEDPRNPHHLEMYHTEDEATGDRGSKNSTTLTTMRSLLRTFTMSTTPPHYGVSNFEPRSFLHHQLTIQLSHDLWWISIAVIIIQLVETSQYLIDPVTFSAFNIVFEVISAYGTVGISTGVPWDLYSFCGAWHTTSKLALCAVMLRGRHRGLPVEVDKAVMLPDDDIDDNDHNHNSELPSSSRVRYGGPGRAYATSSRLRRAVVSRR